MQEYTEDEVYKIFEDAWGLNDPRWHEIPQHEQQTVLEGFDGFIARVNVWLANDEYVAVYENHDFGHPSQGHKRFFSWGNTDAQFDGEPPIRLPDFPGEINWRYTLIGTYNGESVHGRG